MTHILNTYISLHYNIEIKMFVNNVQKCYVLNYLLIVYIV